MTMKLLTVCAAAAMPLALASCAPPTSDTATSRELCRQWRQTLFLPSRTDSKDTAVGLTQAERVHESQCGLR